jgi:hypothetical protein
MRKLTVLIFSIVIAGCQSSVDRAFDQYMEAMESGDCVTARNAVHGLNVNPEDFYYLYGVVAYECQEEPELAIRFFNLSAEYGHTSATAYLLRIGEPIPEQTKTPSSVVYERERQARRAAEMRARADARERERALVPQPSRTTRSPNVERTQSLEPPSSVYLISTEMIIGGNLCHYSDGTTTRIGGGGICPLNKRNCIKH